MHETPDITRSVVAMRASGCVKSNFSEGCRGRGNAIGLYTDAVVVYPSQSGHYVADVMQTRRERMRLYSDEIIVITCRGIDLLGGPVRGRFGTSLRQLMLYFEISCPSAWANKDCLAYLSTTAHQSICADAFMKENTLDE